MVRQWHSRSREAGKQPWCHGQSPRVLALKGIQASYFRVCREKCETFYDKHFHPSAR